MRWKIFLDISLALAQIKYSWINVFRKMIVFSFISGFTKEHYQG